ncbi:MAG: phosphoribosylformylglycinamidine synthase subunit PurS [bacterium]
MMFVADIFITLKKGILDPQGDTVKQALENLGFEGIQGVRMGKFIQLQFKDVDREEAQRLTDEACQKLLANSVIEDFRFELRENGSAHHQGNA